jgi:hypothetical protein
VKWTIPAVSRVEKIKYKIYRNPAMNKILTVSLFIVLVAIGYLTSSLIFKENNKITIKDIISNTTKYIDKDVEVRGKAVDYSVREFVILEDKGARIFVKHNMINYYFKYGDKYSVKGEVKIGPVFGVEGETVYINAKEDLIRNNSWTWI